MQQTYKFSDSGLMSREEAAAYLGITARTLAVWKTRKRYGLPVIKIGRLAKYRKRDLDAFIALRTVSGEIHDNHDKD